MGSGFGAFGKMPGLGDFFRVDTPPGFVSIWDDWVQRCMVSSRQALGSDWDQCFMSAPIWRFTLAAGLAGAQKILGVLMPSVDAVGRQFPLTILAPMAGDATPLADHFQHAATFAELEIVALDMLEDGRNRDDLQARLADIQISDTCPQSALQTYPGSLVMPRGELAGIGAQLAGAQFRSPSIWSADLNASPRTLICEALPSMDQAVGLFDPDAAIWTEAPNT